MILTREFRFEASHSIPNHGGLCNRIHGHSYNLFISVEGTVDAETGMLIDFDDMSRHVEREVMGKLDHGFLNDYIPLPTCEAIAVWIWEKLKPVVPELSEIKLYETVDACAIYRGEKADADAVARATEPFEQTATNPPRPEIKIV
ncbi:MAG: 6-carboxytetrahydropterin synthase [Chrysiogenetes bacterium]|nr:6-carboxytetrahydropterin synthase [Chrysiogenetes bacterium]